MPSRTAPYELTPIRSYPETLQIYRISASKFWQVRLFVGRKYLRKSTKCENKADAIEFAKSFFDNVKLAQRMVTLRQVLKTAVRHGWLAAVPDISMPYRQSTKVSHRAWFSPDEYRQLYTATRENAKRAQGTPWHRDAEQLHDKVLFMANTGIRPDEAKWLEYRDVEIIVDDATQETILQIQVRGKPAWLLTLGRRQSVAAVPGF